jgi:hypothetical protein
MYLPKASIESVVGAIKKMGMGQDDIALILLGEKNAPDLPKLVEALRHVNVRFMGGVFPGILHGHNAYYEGAILLQLPALQDPVVVKNLDKEPTTLPDFGPELTERTGDHYTAIVLADALCPNISSLLRELFNLMGNSAHYMGGGAGSLGLKQKPCVFTAEGVFQNAVVIGFTSLSSSLGVRHGWENLGGPVVATRSTQNTLVELNWRKAFDVYREIVEADCGKKISRSNFFEIAKFYPFGIIKEGAEDIVRDPLALNDRDGLFCAGDIPENAVLNVLKARPERLMEAAEQAAADSLDFKGGRPQQCIVADCISRTLVLDKRFTEELDKVERRIQSVDKNLVPEGILSLGEISSYGEGYIEFFNKTIVVGVLYHAE